MAVFRVSLQVLACDSTGSRRPILYAQNGQVNAIAPFTLIPGPPVTVEVEYNVRERGLQPQWNRPGRRFSRWTGQVPGQAAMLNQDGTVNGPENPARTGSIVSLFLTGTGQTSPILREGELHQPLKRSRFRILASRLLAEPSLC